MGKLVTGRWTMVVLAAMMARTAYADGGAAPPSTTPEATAAAGKVPSSAFAEQPFMRGPIISPDGNKVVARVVYKGEDALIVSDFTNGRTQVLPLGTRVETNWYRWAGNGTLLISIGKTVAWFDDEAFATQLLAYDIEHEKAQFLGGKTEGLVGDDVLWVDPEGKTLLLSYQTSIYDFPTVFSVEIATNKQSKVTGQMQDIWDWYADDQGVVRAGLGYDGFNHWRMVYRANAAEKFRTVVKARNDDDAAGYDVLKFYYGTDQGYVLMEGDDAAGRFGLYKFNYSTRQRGEQVFALPANDIDDFDTSSDGKNLLAAWYVDDRPRVHWFDAALGNVQELLDKAVGAERFARIASRSRDGQSMIVHVGASDDPGAYYYYRQADGMLRKFARVNDKLGRSDLSPTQYVHYTARDGVEIPAYLTLPPHRSAKGLPLVLLPHGGPYSVRDEGDYDAEVQFIASRGYAVLQPEFRGSGGYGKAFYEKGEGQWGRAMQDDLDDGMDWLARQGTIDPKRVCIVGSSYGGYAALWGAVRNPERYRCAASFAGVSDLGRQLKFQLDFKVSKRYRKDWRKVVQGAPAFDLKTVSPLFTIDRLKVPVLLVHGDKDQRVPFKQSKLYANALQDAGKTFEFYPLAGEGHGFSTSANMQVWLDRLEAFLNRYNPAD